MTRSDEHDYSLYGEFTILYFILFEVWAAIVAKSPWDTHKNAERYGTLRI